MKVWRIQQLPVTASTNDDVRRAAEAGKPEGLVVWALKQTAGRGRHGRQWDSPEGNLYCSVLLRPGSARENSPSPPMGGRRVGMRGDSEFINPSSTLTPTPLPPQEGEGLYRRTIGYFSFVAALAMHDAVKNFLPRAAVALKWPNDVLVGGKKIGGILLESGEGWLVIGVGLNVTHHPENGLYPATSLAALSGQKFDLSGILDVLLERLRYWYEILQNHGFTPIRAAWLERAQQGNIAVRLPNQTLEGAFAGIDDNGNLRLRLADGSEKAIATGDVFFGP